MIGFDRHAPGEGVEVNCRIQNGKAHLTWKLYFLERDVDTERNEKIVEDSSMGKRFREQQPVKGYRLHLRLVDKGGNLAAECVQDLRDEEPVEVILLRPNLWQGVDDAHLYDLEARILAADGRCMDYLCRKMPVRELEEKIISPDLPRQLFLNGERLVFRGVRYALKIGEGAKGQLRTCEDLDRIKWLGANCLLIENYEVLMEAGRGELRFLQRVCEEKGILALVEESESREIPEDWGGVRYQKDDKLQQRNHGNEVIMVGREEAMDFPLFRGAVGALISEEDNATTALYYKYAAMWSKHPFIYIVPEHIRKLDSGNYQVTCYSNQSKVALYSGGTFFEMKSFSGEVCFWEVPVKGDYLRLSAEADGCSTALSFHRTFTKLSRIDDN